MDIAQPAPILVVDNYPSAPTITSSQMTISSPTSQYDIKTSNRAIEFNTSNMEYTILSNHNTIMYYYQEPPITSLQQELKDQQNVLPFYNRFQKPIWKLTNRDWHGMTLIYQNLIIVLSTTPPQFRFTFHKRFYHWQVIKQDLYLYTLKCYETESKKLIAELDNDKLILDIATLDDDNTSTNPFRKSAISIEDDPFTTLVILSGLLVNNHVKVLLKSLGGGTDALSMIIDPPAATNGQQHKEPNVFNNMYNTGHDDEEDDITSLSSTYAKNYPGHQSLVDDRGARWSSAESFKSIELDPGVWHCWWGYRFWWSWFPCCMPGGYCDRACIRIKGHKPKVRRNTRTLSKQGWQQQHY